jgi:CheY-like chemotaxis protein
MGGEITVTSPPEGGSVFGFTLELPTVDDRLNVPSKTLAGHRMLVVMPDGAEPRAVVETLTTAAVEARAVATINEGAALIGAAAAAELPYDAILIDRRTMSEPASAMRLISAAGGRDLAAAVLIAPGARGEIDDLRAAGFAAYLIRPVRRSSLLRIAGEIILGVEGFHADPADAPAGHREVPGRTAATIEVLLAEDNEINALLARAVIEGLGHTVQEVRDGGAAVAAVEAEPERFALILMDLHMPVLDGIAAAQAIRALEKTGRRRPAAIFALTADVLPETRVEAVAAGIDAILEKPVSPQSLRRLIAELTSGASAR